MNACYYSRKKITAIYFFSLGMMSSGLTRLKQLAQGLGDEISDHNEMIDRIHNKADKADVGIASQNTQMKRLLKR